MNNATHSLPPPADRLPLASAAARGRRPQFTDEPLVLRFVIMPNGQLAGMGFGPLSQVPPIDAEP